MWRKSMSKIADTIFPVVVLSIGLLNSCASNAAVQNGSVNAHENISSTTIGVYYENERNLLEAGFINAVNRWLRRYSPQMITRNDNYVKMQAKYDYLYDLELFVKDETFEIVVTLAQAGRRPSDARKDAAHLSGGLLKVMEDYLVRRSRDRN
jgi:hypothetical protein